MSNSDHSALFEALTDCSLDDLVCLVVNIGSRLIHYDHFIAH